MSSTRAIQVAFCGPIAAAGQDSAGGYESCNRRTLAALRRAEVSVVEIPYPKSGGRGLAKLWSYARGFSHLFWSFSRLNKRIVHVTGLYKQFIYFENAMLLIAKLRGSRVIYDVRAGSFERYYGLRGPLYRAAVNRTLRLADEVMIEGWEYSDFVRDVAGKQPFYFPNHIDHRQWGRLGRSRGNGPATIVYVGRLVREKGVETALAASEILARRSFDHKVIIAGSGSPEYEQLLRTKYKAESLEWLGSIDSDRALRVFEQAHFFIFPTTHTGEGHSNALTEAMAAGCVPIASNNGFSPSVIGKAGIVLGLDATAEDYANRIAEVWESGEWEALSSASSCRVKETFDTGVVIDSLIGRYREHRGRLCRV